LEYPEGHRCTGSVPGLEAVLTTCRRHPPVQPSDLFKQPLPLPGQEGSPQCALPWALSPAQTLLQHAPRSPPPSYPSRCFYVPRGLSSPQLLPLSLLARLVLGCPVCPALQMPYTSTTQWLRPKSWGHHSSLQPHRTC
jgi:hypothetical protein